LSPTKDPRGGSVQRLPGVQSLTEKVLLADVFDLNDIHFPQITSANKRSA